jgi:putative transferase (TIGR04331 family)
MTPTSSHTASGAGSRNPSGPRVLVTTRVRGTWDGTDDVLLAGPWCAGVSAAGLEPIVHGAQMLPYHWDDRKKLALDYEYLQSLHHKLLAALARSLNRLHGRQSSTRYWQMLLDPWLLSYVSVMFDRWETLRLAFAGDERFATGVPEDDRALLPPFSYTQFIDGAMSDEWNFALFARMLRFQYADRCTLRTVRTAPRAAAQTYGARSRRAGNTARTAAAWLDRLLAPFSASNRIVLLGSYFHPTALLRLSLRLRCVPRLYFREFPDIDASGLPEHAHPDDGAGRERAGGGATLTLDVEPQNDFERYLFAFVAADLPECVVEHFGALLARTRTVKLQPQVIVTAMAHFTHALAKAWIAERIEAGTQLVLLEHGGSFPAPRELFDFDEDLGDVRAVWFRPYHTRHVQLPPSKLVGHTAEGRAVNPRPGEFCLVVGNESPHWTIRAHFYPMAAQCLHSFEQTCAMIGLLSGDLRNAVRVRPGPDVGWNLGAGYAERFGRDAILQGGTLTSAFDVARVIVCTYPETTFSEAMATGRPVVLLYPEEVYERHPVAAQLLARLKQACIVFHDAAKAAAHLNAIWADPAQWWDSPAVKAAREEFFETALRVRGDWLSEWARFLASMAAANRSPRLQSSQ